MSGALDEVGYRRRLQSISFVGSVPPGSTSRLSVNKAAERERGTLMLGSLSQDPGPWTGAAQIQVSLPSSVKPFLGTPSQTQTPFPTAVANPVKSTVKTGRHC